MNIVASESDYDSRTPPLFSADPGEKARAEFAAEIRQIRETAQHTIDRRMASLRTLDFADLDAAIAWLEGIGAALDVKGVTKDPAGIAAMFDVHGHQRVNYETRTFDANDRESFGRWIISEALESIWRHGWTWPTLPIHAAQWRARFAGDRREVA